MIYKAYTILLSILLLQIVVNEAGAAARPNHWTIQSIDTMKYSRDVARDRADDTGFEDTINHQVKLIADTGATHVAIGTPYDKEFIPFLKSWVKAARDNDLNVWLRGNFSGWERWFDYQSITREEHKRLLQDFLAANGDIFEDGDIFTPCPECENGGPGDPRQTGDVAGYRTFMIEEYEITKNYFADIGKDVISNFNSMNGDVARLVMDPATADRMDNIVVIDHYVEAPEELAADIDEMAKLSDAKIVLGEFGAPIPDIHGPLTPTQQADWLRKVLELLSWNQNIVGLNYWTNTNSSTQLWSADAKATPAQTVLADFYTSRVISGRVTDNIRSPLEDAMITYHGYTTFSDSEGHFFLPHIPEGHKISVDKAGYGKKELPIEGQDILVTLDKTSPFYLRLFDFILRFFD